MEPTSIASIYNSSKPKVIPHSEDKYHYQGLEKGRDGDSYHVSSQLAYLACAEKQMDLGDW